MKTVGIIAEYNPFHNGHLRQLRACRQRGASHIAVVMGGNFMQRGEPALLEKSARAQAALRCGADLVLELPLPYACATAERFAFGAVASLDALGAVDALCFGSETGDLSLLEAAARALESQEFSGYAAPFLKKGMTFAAARQAAVEKLAGPAPAAVLSRPNDLLAVEYLRQLCRLHSGMRPEAILRTGAGHDSPFPAEEGENLASASYIRGLLRTGCWDRAAGFVPEESLAVLRDAFAKGLYARPERLEPLLLYRLRSMTAEEYTRLPDLSEGLENRILSAARQGTGLEDILSRIKTKRYPLARLRRILLTALLQIPADMATEPPPYLRVLAMNKRGEEILSRAGKRCRVPVSGSLARLEKSSPQAARYAALEARSTDVYRLLTETPAPCGTDYTFSIIKELR